VKPATTGGMSSGSTTSARTTPRPGSAVERDRQRQAEHERDQTGRDRNTAVVPADSQKGRAEHAPVVVEATEVLGWVA
jgi:hypothetical protein